MRIAARIPAMLRTEFRDAVFERDGYQCVVCKSSLLKRDAGDAHHLLERRLWPDGGYHLDNGVTLCRHDHWEAEKTLLGVEELRERAGISKVIVPPHMEIDERYDKWGNVYLANGLRSPGELFWDPSVQKILAPVLDQFLAYVKYPRTLHLPYSPGATEDDRVLSEVPFIGQEVVITEKLDGENTTMYWDHIHARSIDSGGHPSRSWVKNLHGKIRYDIPKGWRVCGENLQAQHAIAYRDLPSFFLVFSIWDERNVCLSWEDTIEWADLLELSMVPQLWSGKFVAEEFKYSPRYSEESEGYVARVTREFSYREFRSCTAKYVRQGHVNPGTQNWFARQVVENLLAGC